MGYHLIKFLRQLMPFAPLIIFSEHEDMGHISRAFHEGATWFLKKSEASDKLKRHFIMLQANREWGREQRVLKSLHKDLDAFKDDQSFIDKFNRKTTWQYLIFKSLETFPGHFIKINKFCFSKTLLRE